jgi:erythromycin esterase-like protein
MHPLVRSAGVRIGPSLVLAACGHAPSPLPASALTSLPAPWQTSLSPAVASELARAVSSHDVFGIGEGDHYVTEKFAYRLALLRPLVVEHGLRQMGLEMGASDARRIDRYLESGDEAWLQKVVLYGYRGETEDEQRELAPVTRGARRACDDAWVADERRFFRDLRALGEEVGERVHVFGFDFDAVPGGGYADARLALDGCVASPEVDALRPQLTPPRSTSSTAELSRLDDVVRALDSERAALDAACTAPSVAEARDALSQLAASYRIFFDWRAAEADTSSEGPARLLRMFVEREERMWSRFSAWRSQLAPGAKIALLGHDLHVARDSEALRYGRAPHDAPMWASLGTRIERERPGTIWVSWLLYGTGTRYAPAKQSALSTVTLREDALEAYLAATDGDSVVWTSLVPPGSPLDRPLPFGTETSEGSGPVRSSVDAIVFVQRGSASPGCAP